MTDGRRRPLPPDSGSDAREDVLELDCGGPLVPRSAAAALAVASLVQHLVLAPASDVEAQLEDACAVAEDLRFDGSGGRPAHGKRSFLTRRGGVAMVCVLAKSLVRDQARPPRSAILARP